MIYYVSDVGVERRVERTELSVGGLSMCSRT